MTKHLYLCTYNDRLAYVLVGWDNNRQGYYMILDYQNGTEETAIFSNLFSRNSYYKTLDKYLHFLRTKNIRLPQQMIDAILRDGFSRTEDREVTHIMDQGQYKQYESIDYAIL